MTDSLLNVLVIEDNENDYKLLLRSLDKGGIAVNAQRVETMETLQGALRARAWDVVISDNNIPDRRINVRSSMEMARRENPFVPFIIVSGTIGDENAVNLMKGGANDYILKDNLSRLIPAMSRELAEARNRREKLKAEQKLHESEERYRLLAESINDMFFALNKDLKCTFWNKAAEKITKLPAVEVLGRHFLDIFRQLRYSAVEQRFMECFETHTADTIELEYQMVNSIRHYQVSVYPSIEMHSIIVKDITESKHTARRLKKVNEELETFIYRVSHDIRGPVASIQGLLNLAISERPSKVADDFFVHVSRMTNRMHDVIKALQDVVKIKEGEVKVKPAQLSEIVEGATQLAGVSPEELNIEFTDETNEAIITDPEMLTLTFAKIIANARDFKNRSKGNLRIECGKSADNYYELRFTDNGLGMSEEIQERIFTMFYRGSTRSNGPGLGLYLAASAVEKMGGVISVKSVEGIGSEFTVLLPPMNRVTKKDQTAEANLFKIEHV